MTLKELYNIKLNEYNETGLRERPWKLLAMLLLSEKDKFEALRNSQGEFYKKYKDIIDEKIIQVEKDFCFTRDDIIEFIERTIVCENYEEEKVWFVFAEGFGALNWGLLYHEDKTGEEIYSEYFDDDDLKRSYNINQMAAANGIRVSKLDELIDKIMRSPREFYIKISEQLTAEERIFILKNLENKSCMNCTNGTCRIPFYEKIGFDEFGKPEGSNCIGWLNEELIGRSKVLGKSDIKKLK